MNIQKVQEQFDLNTRAWNGEEVFPLKAKKLDSSIKKNTGFIKKLKQGINKNTCATLLKDLREISLEKYLSEVINTTNESLASVPNKNEDIAAAVDVIGALHQRFGQRFTPYLIELFLSNFSNPCEDITVEKFELLRINRLKANLRIFSELYLYGVIRSIEELEPKTGLPKFLLLKKGKASPLIYSVLKEILHYRFKEGYSTSIAIFFLKRFPMFLDSEESIWDDFIFDSNLKNLLQSLFRAFMDAVFTYTIDLNNKTNKLMKDHQKCQIRTGKERNEYIDEFDELYPIFERFKNASQSLSEFFKVDPPKIEETFIVDYESANKPMITNQILPPDQRVWENEDTRKFYELLPDLKDILESMKNEKSAPDPSQIKLFFEDMEMVETKEGIDDLIRQYWKSNLDNKATRNKLIKFFTETQDWSKLRLYARFLAANAPYLPETKDEFVNMLDSSFRSQLHSNRINVKNIIFFSEMVKFAMVPKYLIFHKIRSLIMNMQVPNNIEILTVLFEQLGRFLINHPEYKDQMEKLVDLIKEKRKDRQLHMNTKGALDNLITLIYPPSVKSLNNVEDESPEQEFLRILIRRELSTVDTKLATNLVKRSSWTNPDISRTLFKLFTTPESISYQYIPILTTILNGLKDTHPNFVVKCVDQILENIQRGLEKNEYNENMRRIAQIRYLTEMFNLNIVNSEVIIETIYRIIKFGYPNGQPLPSSINQFDLPDNYFRIQLVTMVLLNLEKYPNYLKKRLELLLRFFELYMFTKQQPIPKESMFRVTNTFEKYKKQIGFERSENLIECNAKLTIKLKSMNVKPENSTPADKVDSTIGNVNSRNYFENNLDEEDEDEDEDDEEDYDDEDNDYSDTPDNGDMDAELSKKTGHDIERSILGNDDDEGTTSSDSNSNDSEDSDTDEDSDSDSDSDDDYRDIDVDRDVERRKIYNEYQEKLKSESERKIEEDFEKQFQMMMQTSMESRKNEKVTSNIIPLIARSSNSAFPPDKPKILRPNNITADDTAPSKEDDKPKKVAFTFLTKTVKKTKSRTLELPSNVKFVSNVLQEEERLKSEREKIKNIVLQRTFD